MSDDDLDMPMVDMLDDGGVDDEVVGQDETLEEPSTGWGRRSKVSSARRKGAAALTQLSRGRLNFADEESDALSADAQLDSVVGESTPGAAMDLLRRNTRFAFPDLEAYALIVLPTRGAFGGLSRRSRTEDKGTLINLLAADDIHALVTRDLLDSQALGIIPDIESLERMKEFSILTGAEYLYVIACEDVDTGALQVFPVPVVDEATATDRKIFDQVVSISTGAMSITEVIDPRVVAAMLTIYRDPKLGPGEAAEAIDAAVEANTSFLVDQVYRDHYPSPVEVVANLAQAFPGVGIEAGPPPGGSGRHRIEDTGGPLRPAAQAVEGSDSIEEDEVVVEADDPFADEPFAPVESEEIEDEVVVLPDEPATTEPSFSADDVADDEQEPSDSDGGPDLVQSRPAAAAGASINRDELAAIVSDATATQLRTLREELAEALGTPRTPGGHRLGAPPAQGAVDVEPGSDFSYEDVVEAAQRRYANSDLGLFVDASAFRGRFASPAPTVEVPESNSTPWLGEQAQALVGALNAQLKQHHDDRVAKIFRKYLQLADLAVDKVTRDFDPRMNPDSKWGQAYATIEADRQRLEDDTADNRLAAEDKMREFWKAREEQFVADAQARARHEFTHRNGPKIESEIREAGEKVLAMAEEVCDRQRADFNEIRGAAARATLDQMLSAILAELDLEFDEMAATEATMVEGVESTIKQYIEEHREDDLHLASVTERKLEADRRYEIALAEAASKIEAERSDSQKRVAALHADMERRTREHEEQMRISSTTQSLNLTSERDQNKVLRNELESERARHARLVEHEKELANRTVEGYKQIALQAREERDEALEKMESGKVVRYAAAAFLCLVVAVLAFLAGTLL